MQHRFNEKIKAVRITISLPKGIVTSAIFFFFLTFMQNVNRCIIGQREN